MPAELELTENIKDEILRTGPLKDLTPITYPTFRTFGIPCVLLRRGVDPLFGWRNLLGKHSLEIWNVVPLCEVAVVEGQE